MKRLALLNKDRDDFQYNSGDLVYIISHLTSQLRTESRKVSLKYIGPLAVYKIVDPHNYLLITLDRKLLRGLFKHERLKPAVIRTNQVNVTKLIKVKTSYVFQIITKLCLPDYYYCNENNDDESNYAQLLEMWINDKVKMDRRFFLMQDINVRQL